MGGEASETASLGLIWGAKKIAAFIGRSPETTWRLLEKGLIPATKLGSKWVTTPGKLKEAFSSVLPADGPQPPAATKPRRRWADA